MSDRAETAISPHPSKHSCTDISELKEVKTKDMEVNVPSASVASQAEAEGRSGWRKRGCVTLIFQKAGDW